MAVDVNQSLGQIQLNRSLVTDQLVCSLFQNCVED